MKEEECTDFASVLRFISRLAGQSRPASSGPSRMDPRRPSLEQAASLWAGFGSECPPRAQSRSHINDLCGRWPRRVGGSMGNVSLFAKESDRQCGHRRPHYPAASSGTLSHYDSFVVGCLARYRRSACRGRCSVASFPIGFGTHCDLHSSLCCGLGDRRGRLSASFGNSTVWLERLQRCVESPARVISPHVRRGGHDEWRALPGPSNRAACQIDHWCAHTGLPSNASH